MTTHMDSTIDDAAEWIAWLTECVARMKTSAPTYQRWVLKHGKCFPVVAADTLSVEGERGEKLCYANALTLMTRIPGLTYVQGYALWNGLEIPHAWVIDSEERVIDPTWSAHPGESYFGVAFDTEFAMDMWRAMPVRRGWVEGLWSADLEELAVSEWSAEL